MKRRAAFGVLGRAAARRLSGPRAFGLARMASGARSVITGHGPRRPEEPGAPAIDPRAELRLASAVAAADHAAARIAATAILRTHPDHLLALEALRDADIADGEPSAALEVGETIRAIDPERRSLRADEALLGLLATSDPRWLPRIPGPAHPVVPTATSGTLEVADATLLAPVDRELPRDVALGAAAWRVACRAEAERPTLIRVVPDPGEVGALQVALAVHRHTGLPVHAEPYRDDPAIPAASELARRRRDVAASVAAAFADLEGAAHRRERT